jgi:hypothetical protein
MHLSTPYLEDYCNLGYETIYPGRWLQTFRMNVLPTFPVPLRLCGTTMRMSDFLRQYGMRKIRSERRLKRLASTRLNAHGHETDIASLLCLFIARRKSCGIVRVLYR